MDTPSSDSHLREALKPLREALLKLHKTLIDSERVTYEKSAGAIPTATAFLHLVTSDPWFAWLRPLSQLITALDEALDSKEPMTQELYQAFIDESKTLFLSGELGNEFSTFYYEVVQRDPDVILAHANVVRHLRPLSPNQTSTDSPL